MPTNTDTPVSSDVIPLKDRFQILFGTSAELGKALPTYQFQFSAALVLVLGWLLTSQGAATFIHQHPRLSQAGSMVLVVFLVAFHTMWLTRHVARAERVHREMESLARRAFPESTALVESVKIDPYLPWSYIAVNMLICGAVVVVCWALASE